MRLIQDATKHILCMTLIQDVTWLMLNESSWLQESYDICEYVTLRLERVSFKMLDELINVTCLMKRLIQHQRHMWIRWRDSSNINDICEHVTLRLETLSRRNVFDEETHPTSNTSRLKWDFSKNKLRHILKESYCICVLVTWHLEWVMSHLCHITYVHKSWYIYGNLSSDMLNSRCDATLDKFPYVPWLISHM